MFLTKLLSRPNCLIFSSNSRILSWAYIAMSNLFSNALYFTINSLMSSYFSDTFLSRDSMSKFLLFSFSSKYSFKVTSCDPINTRNLFFSYSIAAFDSSCKVSMKPFFSPSSWANDWLTKFKWSIVFLNFTFSFSHSPSLCSSSLISSSYFWLSSFKFLSFSSLFCNSCSSFSFMLLWSDSSFSVYSLKPSL